MTFRITRLEHPQGAVLKIDGWLRAEGLPDLEKEIENAFGDPPPGLTLDLAGLRQADEATVGLLRRLAAGGARLVDCPPYLALRLGVPTSPDGHDAHQPAPAPASPWEIKQRPSTDQQER
jgi:hypothetical protein